jgi:hypothetical protein
MAKVTRYTKDRDGNWSQVAADYEHPIPCKVCDRGALVRMNKYRLGGPAVAIGYIFLIPSILGMLAWAGLTVAAVAAGIDATVKSKDIIGGIFAAAFAGTGAVAFIACFVGGLLGFLLTMKKRVLECSACRAVVNAS